MDRVGEGTRFSLDRKIFTSDIWFASPWKLKIWIYLIGHANHKDTVVMGVPLKRGQLIRSYRTIAKDCAYKVGYRIKKPSIDTVRRICEELTKELRIVRRSVQQGTIFTICNYNDLQPQQKARTVQRTRESSYSSRTVGVQDKNDKNVKNNNKPPIVPLTDNNLPSWLSKPLWNDFRNHRKSLKPKMTPHAERLAIKKLKTLMDEGFDQQELVEQTIANGWKSFFPLKQKQQSSSKNWTPPYWEEANNV